MNLSEGELRAFGIHLILIGGQRGERGDGIQHCGRFAELRGVSPHALFPGLAVHVNFHARADGGVRLLARKIRRGAFGRLHLHLLAGLDFDQGFRGGAVLAVGLAPDFAAQDGNIVVERHGGAGAGPAGRAIAELVRIVELVASGAGLHLEPAAAVLGAGKQRAIRAGDFGEACGRPPCS